MAIVVCALVVGCGDEGGSDSALARQDPEADGSTMVDPQDDEDGGAPAHADASTPDGSSELVADGGAPDGSTSPELQADGGAVEHDAGRVVRTNVTVQEVKDTLIAPLCLSCHKESLGNDMARPALDWLYFPEYGGNHFSFCGMKYVTPGQPEMSFLLMVFRTEQLSGAWSIYCNAHPDLVNPPSEAQLNLLEDWIRAGAKQ